MTGEPPCQVTGPPPGIVGVGGYRFVLANWKIWSARGGGAFVTALPDTLAGHRLAGISGAAANTRDLAGLGVNAIVAELLVGVTVRAAR